MSVPETRFTAQKLEVAIQEVATLLEDTAGRLRKLDLPSLKDVVSRLTQLNEYIDDFRANAIQKSVQYAVSTDGLNESLADLLQLAQAVQIQEFKLSRIEPLAVVLRDILRLRSHNPDDATCLVQPKLMANEMMQELTRQTIDSWEEFLLKVDPLVKLHRLIVSDDDLSDEEWEHFSSIISDGLGSSVRLAVQRNRLYIDKATGTEEDSIKDSICEIAIKNAENTELSAIDDLNDKDGPASSQELRATSLVSRLGPMNGKPKNVLLSILSPKTLVGVENSAVIHTSLNERLSGPLKFETKADIRVRLNKSHERKIYSDGSTRTKILKPQTLMEDNHSEKREDAVVPESSQTLQGDGEKPINSTSIFERIEKTVNMDVSKLSAEATDDFSIEDFYGSSRETFWSFMENGELELAFWLALSLEENKRNDDWIPASSLLRTLVLARYVHQNTGELMSVIKEDLSSLGTGCVSDREEERLLITAATMRPALLAPNTNAYQVLRDNLPKGLPHLYKWCMAILEYAEKFTPLDWFYVRRAGEEAKYERDIVALKRRAHEFEKTMAKHTFKYAPATIVWRKWMDKDGLIFRILEPILNNDINRVTEVRELVFRLQDPTEMRREVNRTDKE